MIQILLIIVLSVHLVLVNLAMMGPLVCIWLEWRQTRLGDSTAGELGRRLAGLSWRAFLGGVVLGGLGLLLLWLRDEMWLFEAAQRIRPSRLYWGGAELVFYLLCMLAYSAYWDRMVRWRKSHRFLAILAASNLMYHFPPLFIILGKLGRSSLEPGVPISKSQFLAHLVSGEVLARSLHHILASVAICGVVVMLLAFRIHKRDAVGKGDEAASGERLVKVGARLSLMATLAQLPVGVWVFIESPGAWHDDLMGGDLVACGLFVVSLVAVLMLLHYVSAVAMGEVEHSKIHAAMMLLFVTILLMTGAMTRMRGSQDELNSPTDPKVTSRLHSERTLYVT